MLDAALHLAVEIGWPVVWCHPGTNVPGPLADRDAKGEKIPRTGGVCKATRDPEIIRGWWAADPTRNLSVACGELAGVFVLDIDRKEGSPNGFEALVRMTADFGPLPAGPTVRTPHDGEHRYFRHPRGRKLTNRTGTLHSCNPDGTAKALYKGLDIRADGAAACAPPSIRPEGAYSWIRSTAFHALPAAPDWLLTLIDPPEAPRPPRKPFKVTSTDRTAAWVSAAFRGEMSKLAQTGKGGRNLALFQAAANLGEFIGAGALPESMVVSHLEDAAAELGLIREDGAHGVRATILSGLRKGIANPRELVR